MVTGEEGEVAGRLIASELFIRVFLMGFLVQVEGRMVSERIFKI